MPALFTVTLPLLSYFHLMPYIYHHLPLFPVRFVYKEPVVWPQHSASARLSRKIILNSTSLFAAQRRAPSQLRNNEPKKRDTGAFSLLKLSLHRMASASHIHNPASVLGIITRARSSNQSLHAWRRCIRSPNSCWSLNNQVAHCSGELIILVQVTQEIIQRKES